MTLVYYIKKIGTKDGIKVYPKARRTGENVAFVNDVMRVGTKVITKYMGIQAVPDGVQVIEQTMAAPVDVVPTPEKEETGVEVTGT